MRLRMWTYDYAREQAPTLDHLRRLCSLSQESGYNALGLYLEHRFAYPSAPWMQGEGCLRPDTVQALQDEFAELQIVPFINLLGHFEGMLYTEAGKKFAEETFKGMQACPSNEGFVEFARGLLDDAISAFSCDLIHIGGDETNQLGKCARCAARVADFERSEGADGKAHLYGEHFGPLARHVLDRGRTPAVWGDMFLEHPQALDLIPRETVIFDWQYFGGPLLTAKALGARNPIVFSPTLQTYNAAWFHLAQSEMNLQEHLDAFAENESAAETADIPRVDGICLTTWECGLFGNYNTLFPAIRAAGRMLSEPTQRRETGSGADLVASILRDADAKGATKVVFEPHAGRVQVDFHTADGTYIAATVPGDQREALEAGIAAVAASIEYDLAREDVESGTRVTLTRGANSIDEPDFSVHAQRFLASYEAAEPGYGDWARLMAIELQQVGGVFAWKGLRSSLKCRLMLYANPFLAWLHHGQELSGPQGDRALEILDHAMSVAPNVDARGATQFVKSAIEFVRFAEQARQAYAQELPGVAIACLSPARQIFDDLSKVAKATHLNAGGSLADVERCRVAKEHVEKVILRIKAYGDGSLGYLPAFEYITHPKFVPHDQAAWWLINTWANE